jgi:hypothetical protein
MTKQTQSYLIAGINQILIGMQSLTAATEDLTSAERRKIIPLLNNIGNNTKQLTNYLELKQELASTE